MVSHRSALERLWKDRCFVFHQEKVTDPDTKLTGFQEQPLLEDLPCKLSFETLTSTDGDHVAAKFQNVKLFVSSDVVIPSGCKIVIRRFNDLEREFIFSHSGEAGVFTDHQEIYLEPWKGWA
jgi:hypothetical protein